MTCTILMTFQGRVQFRYRRYLIRHEARRSKQRGPQKPGHYRRGRVYGIQSSSSRTIRLVRCLISDDTELPLTWNRATKVRNKILYWNSRHSKPTPAEIKAEIKRLQNLLLSHTALKKVSTPPRHELCPT